MRHWLTLLADIGESYAEWVACRPTTKVAILATDNDNVTVTG